MAHFNRLTEEIVSYYTSKCGKPLLKKSRNRKLGDAFGNEFTYKWIGPEVEPPMSICLKVYFDEKSGWFEKTIKIILN